MKGTSAIGLGTDSDDDTEVTQGSILEDPEILGIESTETSCLMYDARQQQKAYERRQKEATRERDYFPQQTHNLETTLPPVSTKNETLPSTAQSPSYRLSEPPASASASVSPSRRSSLDRQTFSSILGHQTPAPSALASRIHFSNSVRISGGSKSHRKHRAVSVSSVSAQQGAPPSPGASQVSHHSSPTSSSRLDTPRGSFSRGHERVASLSRPASFVSEDGNTTGRSRASTPASIYAPLLLPSKTAPSPSRRFYLTFQRDNGQATYRELVRRQEMSRKQKRKIHRGRERDRLRGTSSNGASSSRIGRHGGTYDNGSSEDESSDSNDNSDTGDFGSGWFCGMAFWTCGLNRAFRHWARRRRRHARLKMLAEEANAYEDGEGRPSASSDTGSEYSNVSGGREEHKTELEVLFGQSPWRYLKLNYWLYRVRALRTRVVRDDEDDGEGGW